MAPKPPPSQRDTESEVSFNWPGQRKRPDQGVLEGRLLHGATGNAGHIGHVVVVPDGRACACGGRGCLEAEASGLAIAAITGRPAADDSKSVAVASATRDARATSARGRASAKRA